MAKRKVQSLRLKLSKIRLDFNQKIKKYEVCPEAERVIALDTVHNCYPASEWLHSYSDGPFLTSYGAETGIFCELTCFYWQVENFSTDGEESIYITLQKLFIRQSFFEKVVIFSDSTSSLQDLCPSHERISPRIQFPPPGNPL
ncbi:hypothetical protein TNCV_2622371 [Trichonephila clavipes]|uniref:Uncharacterized protein n=1 Tax=Trichonephila clavipes TaxID=2585209 RepID=A0A8X7BI39_TRICX|nr:hypothetical protein TNCV_2622371 [Trichonephila clavipes]